MKRSPCSQPVRSIRVEMLCAPLWHDSPRPRQMCLFVKILISEIVTFLMPRAASSEIRNCLLATGLSHCSSDSAFHGHLHIFSLDILHCGAPLENDLLFAALELQCWAEVRLCRGHGRAHCPPGSSSTSRASAPEPSLYGMNLVTSSFKPRPEY